jgi:hypothetical protein
MIGPHRETPQALLRVPYGLIDKIDLVHGVVVLLVTMIMPPAHAWLKWVVAFLSLLLFNQKDQRN